MLKLAQSVHACIKHHFNFVKCNWMFNPSKTTEMTFGWNSLPFRM